MLINNTNILKKFKQTKFELRYIESIRIVPEQSLEYRD